MEQDRVREKREADELKARLQTKAGEADMLRRSRDFEFRRYEDRLTDQQQQHSTDIARLKAEIERLRREKDQAQTDNMFNQHDAREAGMAQRTKKSMPSRPKSTTYTAIATVAASPTATPKRMHKTQGPLGDGFDDEDVVMASPSKSRDRNKTATPRQAGKRKRHIADKSPIPLPSLQLSEPPNRLKNKAPEQTVVHGAIIDAGLLQYLRQHDNRFTLLHRLLSHPSSNGTDRILEGLALYAFPSQPLKKLSSLVYDSLAAARLDDVHKLAHDICHIFLDLWQRCLNERYYDPLYLILDTMHFMLACEPVETAQTLAERCVPLIIASVDLVSLPISNAARLGEKAVVSLYSSTQRDTASKINVADCLDLLYLISSSCVSSTDPEAIHQLWRTIPSSFAIMLLNKEHPQPQIMLMLRILSTSALATTIGPIAAEEESQASVEDALINRLTNIFTEVPSTILDPRSSLNFATEVPEHDIWDLRLLVLVVLTQFSITEHGSTRLAQNRICIGRLIKYLDASITSLYRKPLSPLQGRKVDSINTTMKLIYHITTTNVGFDIKSKLVNTLGGQHAYLVALTRLAFSEGLVLEAGIEDAVVDMAHSILDEGLSPQEGDAFGMVFSSGSSA